MQTLPEYRNGKERRIFVVEREYLGKYSIEEFMKRVIKSHLDTTTTSKK